MSNTKLWWLQEIGLDVRDGSRTEWVCVCPFDDDCQEHLYLNSEKLVYDCKKCGTQGNYSTLMAQLTTILADGFDDEAIATLAEDRHLPPDAFDGYGFGWTGRFFTLPVRDGDGTIQNVLRYKLGDSPRSAPDCKMGLFGAQHLADRHRGDEPVYLVEGPWDAIALDWLRRKAKQKGIVTAVLGAGHLPDDQVGLLRDRKVHVIQDNDEAGAKGEARIAVKLTGVARSLAFFQWNEDDDAGMDIRDIIVRSI